MTVEEAEAMSPFERELLSVLNKIRRALEDLAGEVDQ
jgi:hypothetical protein